MYTIPNHLKYSAYTYPMVAAVKGIELSKNKCVEDEKNDQKERKGERASESCNEL